MTWIFFGLAILCWALETPLYLAFMLMGILSAAYEELEAG